MLSARRWCWWSRATTRSARARRTPQTRSRRWGSGAITVDQGILLAIGAIGLGALTIARRTLATVGEGITDLPILAVIIVSLVGVTVIMVLSGLGFRRASR